MSPEPTMLERVASVMRDVVSQRPWGAPPILFAVDGPLDAAEFGFLTKEFDGHPVPALLDLDVPASWSALGVAAEGNKRSLDDLAAPPTDRVGSVVVADRTGAMAGGCEFRNGGGIDHPPPEGRVVDALLCALGVPTAPPPAPAGQLLAVFWLSAVVRAAREQGRPLSWRAAADLQPDIDARELDWAAVRRVVVNRGWQCGGLDAARATRLDDGAFARFVLGEYERVADLLAEARGLLQPSVVRRVRQALRAWEVRLDA